MTSFHQTVDRSITIYYTVMVEFTVFCMIVSSLVTDFRNQRLAYEAWLPFNCSAPNYYYYYIAYVHQIIALIGTSLLNVACDVTICGLFVHMYSQQEILKHRLKESVNVENRLNIGKIVHFHNYLYGLVRSKCLEEKNRRYHSKRLFIILPFPFNLWTIFKRTYRYAFMVQEKFKKIIGIQLLSSTLVVCFILYKLANTSLISTKFLEFVLYLACMMTQIFVYCWYGNQLKLKVNHVLVKIMRVSNFNFVIHARKSPRSECRGCGHDFRIRLDLPWQ